ncbi:TPA: class I SAM-dependent methyltransferase [Candidatus Poribacteria bacterium]|nr:class I SAM-dependent methyltransferase [Candidatus Poribacteria bacterium]HIO50371.1 class I SAM-dependent methyltransferase [Candidatus Poribacteria bacterium]
MVQILQGNSLQLYREKQPEADLLKLDATTIETDRSFDCIYSNKVLHHLSKSDLRYSFTCQQQLLTDGGLLMHSFWYSDKEEESYGFRLLYRR